MFPLPNRVSRLVIVRGLRSFSQGYLNIIAPLYLLSIGLTATGMGLLLTASFILGAVLLVPVGTLADRYGRKPFLVGFCALMAIWGATYVLTKWLPLLFAISAVAGIGRGGPAGGAQAGPFAPAEQALMADLVPSHRRVTVFSLNAFIASILAATGSLFSGIPSWLDAIGFKLPLGGGDYLLFLMTAIIGVLSIPVLLTVPESTGSRRRPRDLGDAHHGKEEARETNVQQSKNGVDANEKRSFLKKESAVTVSKISLASAFNSFGMGFMGSSLFVVWLNLRFHVGAGLIGPVFAASYLLTALTILGAPTLASKIGSVHSIVITRIAASILFGIMVIAPTFIFAAGIYIARLVFTGMITPVRQSFTMGLFPTEERATAAGITGSLRRVTGAISPSLSGALMELGYLESPFLIGGVLQGISAVLYAKFFLVKDDKESPRQTETTDRAG